MSEEIKQLIRPELLTLNSYSASKPPETLAGSGEVPIKDIIKLDANENPYGCSPRVHQALAAYPSFSVYPDSEQTELRALLADYSGVGAERIVVGNGSDQLIDLLIRLFVGPGDEVINLVPTFGIYRFSTQVQGGTLVEVLRDEDFAVNVEAVKAAIGSKTKIIFLSNPNNPTGNITPQKDILELVATGIPVLVDEAYYEFSKETVVPLVSRYKNLMVLRTFSKWAGLAGLRIGYGIFSPKVAEYLLTIKVPYSINVAAQVAVRESLRDADYLMGRVKAILAEGERLFTELQNVKWLKAFPSRANFIFCSVLNGKASEIQQKLEHKGILVRYFDQPFLNNAIRISVGKPEHTDALIKALQEIGEEING